MADPHVKDVSASSVLHDPPDSTVGMTKQSNKGNEPEIIEVGGQHCVPGGGGGSSHPRGDRDIGTSGADGKIGASSTNEEIGLSGADKEFGLFGADGKAIATGADGKIGAAGANEEIGLSVVDRGIGSRQGGEVTLDPAFDPRSPPHRRAPNPDPHVFYEADHAEPWFRAVEIKDCRRLMEILRDAPYESRALCCHKTGKEGRTALHVAAMQGCFRLAKQVIDYKVDEASETMADFERAVMQRIDISISVEDFIDAKDGRSGLTAYEMANDIIGNRSITQYIKYVKKEYYEVTFEAYPGTEWHAALAKGRCDILRNMLRCNTRYLFETCDGFTALDVAILMDDGDFVQLLVDIFGSNQIISWGASYFPIELSWNQMMGPRPLPQVRCPVLKDTFVGKITRKEVGFFNSVGSALELAKKLKKTESTHVLAREVDTDSDSELFDSEVPELIDFCNKQLWKPQWDEGFLADVDYNFEDEDSVQKSILRFHYACKDLEKFGGYILGTLQKLIDSMNYFIMVALCGICDGQGRTPFHTMLDYYNFEKHPNLTFEKLLLLDESIHQKRNALLGGMALFRCDSKGRSPFMRAITKQYLKNNTMVSIHLIQFYEAMKKIMDDDWGSISVIKQLNVRRCRTWNQVSIFDAAFLFQDEYMQRRIIEGKEPELLETLYFYYLGDNFKPKRHDLSPPPMLLAAASGNQSMLRLLLKMKFNPMIVDNEGRTSLHYAVEANMSKFFPTPPLDYCSIDDLCEVENKWMKKKREEIGSNVNLNMHPNENLNGQPNVGRRACILMLLQEGVDLSQEDKNGYIPDPGTTNDASFQNWWYEILVKDTIDKKNNFNLAGNALSVVGTLVAATSYIGPLQPPLNYNDIGYVETSKVLVKVFMVSNTLAFYLAVASVMFAVVPSLPMPQEGVIDELRRARHTVSSSLCLLLASIGCILVSFAAASAVVVENEHYYGSHDFLLSPSIIGWFFCLIAIVSFFIRLMRLIFYKSTIIRYIYKFSFSTFCMEGGTFIFYAFYMGVYGIRYFLFNRWRHEEDLQDFLQYRKEVFNQLWMG